MAKISELVVEITGDNSGLKKSLNESVGSTDAAFSKIGKAIAGAGLAAGVLGAAVKGIEFNKAAEQAQASFEVMLGSAEKAKSMLTELKNYANTTPLEFADLRESSQVLVQFGMGADEAMSTIKQLGDVSGGNADKLKSLAIAMGQISSAGKMQGQDLMQLINAGFNPLNVIAEKTGKSMADLKKEMEAGAISSDMVKDAFKAATSEGGQFFGMLEKQSKTLAGVQSTLNDAVDTFLGKMTQAATGPLKSIGTMLTGVLNVATNLPEPLLAAGAAIIGIGTAFVTAGGAAKLFGLQLSAALGPIGIAVAGLTAGVVALAVQMENVKQGKIEAGAKQFDLLAKYIGVASDGLDDFYQRTQNVQGAMLRMKWDKSITDKQNWNELGESLKRLSESTGVPVHALATMGIEIEGLDSKVKSFLTSQAKVTMSTLRDSAALDKNGKAITAAANERMAAAKKAEEEAKAAAAASQAAYEKELKRQQELEDATAESNRKKRTDAEWNADVQIATWAAMDKAYGASVDSQVSADKEAGETKKSNAKAVYAELDKAHADSLARQQADREAAEAASRARFKAGMQETISGIQGAFNAVGSSGAKAVGSIMGIVQSISKGGIWAAIGQAIELAFSRGGKGAENAIAKIDAATNKLFKALQPVLDIIFDIAESSADTIDIFASILDILKPIFQMLREVTKVFTFLNKEASKFFADLKNGIQSIGNQLTNVDWGEKVTRGLRLGPQVAELSEEAKKTAESLGGTISGTLADALSNGLSAQDMFANLKDQMKKMAIEAIMVASGVQMHIKAIAEKVVSGNFSRESLATMKQDLSWWFGWLQEKTSAVSGIFDELMPTVAVQSPTTGVTSGTTSTQSNQSDTLGYGNSIVVNINSPVQLNPSEAAAVMRSSMRQLSYQGAFA